MLSVTSIPSPVRPTVSIYVNMHNLFTKQASSTARTMHETPHAVTPPQARNATSFLLSSFLWSLRSFVILAHR